MAQKTTAKSLRIGPLEFDCRVCGDPGNALVVLLHGFPETSIMWAGLMEQLAELGFYCVAPDMRGYSKNACPRGVKQYTLEKLTDDVLQLATALKKKRFHLVGHDWGAAIGWNVTYQHPDRILSWCALSVPHTRAFFEAYKTDPVQKKKSRYISFFLIPFLPELLIRRNDFKGFRRLWKNSSAEEVQHYLSVFRNKACLTGALNYYRANIGKRKTVPIGEILTPTLFIWGKNDLAIGETAVKGNASYVKGDYTAITLDAGHWLIQTHFREVAGAISKHLTAHKTGDGLV